MINYGIYKNQRVCVLVDVQNMYYSAKNLYNCKVSFSEILKTALRGRQLVRAVAYTIKADVKDEGTFHEALEKIGFEVKTKDLLVFHGGHKKGDWDVGIAVDGVRAAEKVDTLVVVSGDGDFKEMYEYVRGKGCRVEVLSFGRTASSSIKGYVDHFVDMDKDKKYLIPLKPGGKIGNENSNNSNNNNNNNNNKQDSKNYNNNKQNSNQHNISQQNSNSNNVNKYNKNNSHNNHKANTNNNYEKKPYVKPVENKQNSFNKYNKPSFENKVVENNFNDKPEINPVLLANAEQPDIAVVNVSTSVSEVKETTSDKKSEEKKITKKETKKPAEKKATKKETKKETKKPVKPKKESLLGKIKRKVSNK